MHEHLPSFECICIPAVLCMVRSKWEKNDSHSSNGFDIFSSAVAVQFSFRSFLCALSFHSFLTNLILVFMCGREFVCVHGMCTKEHTHACMFSSLQFLPGSEREAGKMFRFIFSLLLCKLRC